MTVAAQQLLTMIPKMPVMIPRLTEDKAQQILNIFVEVENLEKPAHTDIADSGLFFGDDITDENHDERMARAFALAREIEIDEQAFRHDEKCDSRSKGLPDGRFSLISLAKTPGDWLNATRRGLVFR